MILFKLLWHAIAYEYELSTDQKTLSLKGLNENIIQAEFRNHGKYDALQEVTFEGFYALGTALMKECYEVTTITLKM